MTAAWRSFVLSWLCHRSVLHAAATPCSSSQSSHRCGTTVNGGGERVANADESTNERHAAVIGTDFAV